MNNSLLLIIFSIVCGVGGQIALKMGMTQVGPIGEFALAQPLPTALKVFTNLLVIGGLGLYVLGALSWLTVLSRVPLSFAYPFIATSYAFTPVLAWLILGENVPSLRWLGIVVICLGVIMVSRS
ncbi:MAG: EamA family transporter [Chloroflexota bacterium]